MQSIKVAYQSTVRRFAVSDTITWFELESKLRELFSLPSSFKFSLTYTDEEGDFITLSTDLELQEFLSSQTLSTLKFILTPEQQQHLVIENFSSNASDNDFVSIEKEKFIPDNVSEKTDKHVTVMEMDEPSFKPTIPSTSKGKQKGEPQEQEEKQEQPSPNNDEQQAPFIELAEQFQRLLDQFKDVLSNNPQLIEQANNIMDQILHCVPVDIDQWAQWLNTFRPEGDTSSTNAQEGESNNSRGDQQQQQRGGFGQFPSFFPPPHDLLSSPWIQRIAQDVSANIPGGLGNFENFARSTGFNGGCPFQQRQREELSQEELKEKIKSLHSMGFWEDDVKNEELLKRYNGNMERVVEILIRQQTEQNSNNSHETYNPMENIAQ